MLSGVVLDALLFLVVDGVCCLLEEGGLLRGMRVTDHYVENMYESSTREKKISNLPKICWKIEYLFCYFSKGKRISIIQRSAEDSLYFYCSLRTRKRV